MNTKLIDTCKIITEFDCNENSIYLNSIINYELFDFKTHKLEDEIVNSEKSRLVCEFNKDNGVINDLSPFWRIFDLVKSGEANHITLTNLINDLNQTYRFKVPKVA